VRGEHGVIDLGEGGDASHLGYPSGVGEIGLDDSHAGQQRLEEVPARVQSLTGR